MAVHSVHVKESVDWGTPSWCIDAARSLMGAIDLDPSSSPFFNEYVQAARFYTKEDNGLEREWGGNVLVNPPGRHVIAFWNKLVDEYMRQRTKRAVWVGFNLDHLRQLGKVGIWPLDFFTCIPHRRMQYRKPDGTVPKSATAANYITYLPSMKLPEDVEWDRFRGTFGRHGRCFRTVWDNSAVATDSHRATDQHGHQAA